jgi:phosphoadenosine phosphosulfate reductase
MALEDKIKYSIQLIQKAEELALKLNPEGFYLAFSGGKDSQVIYELTKMAGVKFKAYMNLTTIDPPEVIRFIREEYPDVTIIKPKKSFFKWIESKELPTRQIRWCCEKLKEVGGRGSLVITGIRKAESPKRAKRKEFEDHSTCKYDKQLLNPIMTWTDADVWNFLRNNIGYWCCLYDKGYKRIGCIACPFTSARNKQRDINDHPRYKYPFIKSIQKNIDKGKYQKFETAEDVFSWYLSQMSVKQYLAMKNQTKIPYCFEETEVGRKTLKTDEHKKPLNK